jgi:hypothetical protein
MHRIVLVVRVSWLVILFLLSSNSFTVAIQLLNLQVTCEYQRSTQTTDKMLLEVPLGCLLTLQTLNQCPQGGWGQMVVSRTELDHLSI